MTFDTAESCDKEALRLLDLCIEAAKERQLRTSKHYFDLAETMRDKAKRLRREGVQ